MTRKIVLIDDSPEVSWLLRDIIEDMLGGSFSYYHEIDYVEDMLTKEKPDIVLIDYILGEKSGIDIAKKILEIDPNQNVYLLTGYNLESITPKVKNTGIKGIIPKPFEINDIKKLFLSTST